MKAKALNKIEKLNQKIFSINGAFHVWKTLEESYRIPDVGEEIAKKNASVMSLYPGFFQTTLRAIKHFCLIEIAKLFDYGEKNKKCISLPNLIDFISSHKDKINNEPAHKIVPIHHESMDLNTGESKNWIENKEIISSITDKGIMEINRELASIEIEINKIKDFRDRWLAHNEESPKLPNMVISEHEKLIGVIVSVFNRITLMLDRSETNYTFSNEQSADDTKALLIDLYKIK